MATESKPATSTPGAAGKAEAPAAPATGTDALWVRLKIMAPHLDREFAAQHGLTEADLEDIATGAQPPPPYIGPVPSVDLHRTPGGWQVTPLGVKPEDLPETGRVHADTASPGETRTQGQTQALQAGQ